MKNIAFASLGLGLLIFSACSEKPKTPATNGTSSTTTQTETAAPVSGKSVFQKQCVVCHGADGRLGLNGAKIIPESSLSAEERINLIQNGRNTMPPFRNLLSPEEITAVAAYTQTLK